MKTCLHQDSSCEDCSLLLRFLLAADKRVRAGVPWAWVLVLGEDARVLLRTLTPPVIRRMFQLSSLDCLVTLLQGVNRFCTLAAFDDARHGVTQRPWYVTSTVAVGRYQVVFSLRSGRSNSNLQHALACSAWLMLSRNMLITLLDLKAAYHLVRYSGCRGTRNM